MRDSGLWQQVLEYFKRYQDLSPYVVSVLGTLLLIRVTTRFHVLLCLLLYVGAIGVFGVPYA